MPHEQTTVTRVFNLTKVLRHKHKPIFIRWDVSHIGQCSIAWVLPTLWTILYHIQMYNKQSGLSSLCVSSRLGIFLMLTNITGNHYEFRNHGIQEHCHVRGCSMQSEFRPQGTYISIKQTILRWSICLTELQVCVNDCVISSVAAFEIWISCWMLNYAGLTVLDVNVYLAI